MAGTSEEGRSEGVEFINEDGLVTAKDLESGRASSGETKAEALAMLAEALELHAGGGEPIEDEEAFFRELGLYPQEISAERGESKEHPEFLR